jgi:amidophosphoribosyltransferase
VACGRSESEICREIGADRLIYQDLEDLIDAAHEGNPAIKQFETSCFDGKYVTGDVSEDYLYNLRKLRSDDAKNRASKALELNDVNSYSYS